MELNLNQLILTSGELVFSSLHRPKDAMVIFHPYDAVGDNPVYFRCTKPLEEQIAYINERQVRRAIVVAENVEFLRQCPSIEELWVMPAHTGEQFDYAPLYDLPRLRYLRAQTVYGKKKRVAPIDYSRLPQLQYVYIEGKKGHLHYETLPELEVLVLDSVQTAHKNLSDCFVSEKLKELYILQADVRSLDGIERAEQLEKLGLYYMRSLTDVSSLADLAGSLRHLTIEACGKISDFSVLNAQHGLRNLRLHGSNVLPSLGFLRGMPELRELTFYMKSEDGDLSLCDEIPFVNIQNRKHYNRKNEELRKEKVKALGGTL